MEYMTLAKTYLECGEPKLSLKCLFQSKEFRLCAELCKKLGKVLHPYPVLSLHLSFSYSFFSPPIWCLYVFIEFLKVISFRAHKVIVSFCDMELN